MMVVVMMMMTVIYSYIFVAENREKPLTGKQRADDTQNKARTLNQK
jgi:hypothetical protein